MLGVNYSGEDNNFEFVPAPYTRDGTFRAVKAIGGDLNFCVIRASDGAIECWHEYRGVHWKSTVADGKFIALGGACDLRTDGAIECWDDDEYPSPFDNPPTGAFRAVSTNSYDVACAIRANDNAIECWGKDTHSVGLTNAPAGNFIAVSVGLNHACAIREDRTIACWGSNKEGQSTPPPDGEFVAGAPSEPQAEQATDRTGAAAQMTIDEYASWCNESRYGAVTPDTTWAEAADLLTETIAEFERVAERLPPEQGLAEYHEVMTEALRRMQSAAQLDDIAGSVTDLFNRDLLNLFNIPEMLELAVRVGIALEGLTQSTRTKLRDGCI